MSDPKWKNLDDNAIAPHYVNVIRLRATTDKTVILDLGYLDAEASDSPVLITKLILPESLFNKLKAADMVPSSETTGKIWLN